MIFIEKLCFLLKTEAQKSTVYMKGKEGNIMEKTFSIRLMLIMLLVLFLFSSCSLDDPQADGESTAIRIATWGDTGIMYSVLNST